MKHDPLSDVHFRKVPRQRRATETVDLILATARGLWSERGPRGYTTSEIARIAGISIGSLYQYFPNKDAVLHALVRQELEQLIEALRSHHAWQREEAGLHDLILALVTHRGRFVAVQKMHCACVDASHPVHVGEPLAGIHDVFVRALERGNFVSDLGIRTVAVDIVAIIHGMLRAASPNHTGDATQLIERIERAVFGYLDASRR